MYYGRCANRKKQGSVSSAVWVDPIYLGRGVGGWVGAKVMIKVFLNFGGTFLAFIYNFTCEITKLL